jgi:hypothetical protein
VVREANRGLADLTSREVAVLAPVLVLIVWIGIYPQPFLRTTDASVVRLLGQVHGRNASGAGFRAPDGAARLRTAGESGGAGGSAAAGGRRPARSDAAGVERLETKGAGELRLAAAETHGGRHGR